MREVLINDLTLCVAIYLIIAPPTQTFIINTTISTTFLIIVIINNTLEISKIWCSGEFLRKHSTTWNTSRLPMSQSSLLLEGRTISIYIFWQSSALEVFTMLQSADNWSARSDYLSRGPLLDLIFSKSLARGMVTTAPGYRMGGWDWLTWSDHWPQQDRCHNYRLWFLNNYKVVKTIKILWSR